LAVKEDVQRHKRLTHCNIPSQIFGRLRVSLAILRPFRVIVQNALRRRASQKVETYQEANKISIR